MVQEEKGELPGRIDADEPDQDGGAPEDGRGEGSQEAFAIAGPSEKGDGMGDEGSQPDADEQPGCTGVGQDAVQGRKLKAAGLVIEQ
jgi:hypothetical protein